MMTAKYFSFEISQGTCCSFPVLCRVAYDSYDIFRLVSEYPNMIDNTCSTFICKKSMMATIIIRSRTTITTPTRTSSLAWLIPAIINIQHAEDAIRNHGGRLSSMKSLNYRYWPVCMTSCPWTIFVSVGWQRYTRYLTLCRFFVIYYWHCTLSTTYEKLVSIFLLGDVVANMRGVVPSLSDLLCGGTRIWS